MHETLEVPAYRTLHILTPLQAVKNVILEKAKLYRQYKDQWQSEETESSSVQSELGR